ncbi:MAG: SH3 domain-containing protein [Bacteroidaceae bacterium]|nr:SH3 domain-containing protein [Bacteroidaceae bacterium]
MRRCSFALLVRVFTLLVAIMSITFVHAAKYRVVTTSTLNVRSAPTTNSDKISVVSGGDIVNVVEKGSDDWMKIELNGMTGYVYGKYLEEIPELSSSVSSDADKFWSRETKFWVHFSIFIVLTIAFIILLEEHGFIAILCNTGAAYCVWTYTGIGDSFWFLDFERNGFFLYMLFVFLIFVFMTWAFTMFWEYLKMTLMLFKVPLLAIVGLITAVLWLAALKDLVFDFLEYHTLMAILILFGSISSGRQFLGVFTDRNGNMWNVYKE